MLLLHYSATVDKAIIIMNRSFLGFGYFHLNQTSSMELSQLGYASRCPKKVKSDAEIVPIIPSTLS